MKTIRLAISIHLCLANRLTSRAVLEAVHDESNSERGSDGNPSRRMSIINKVKVFAFAFFVG